MSIYTVEVLNGSLFNKGDLIQIGETTSSFEGTFQVERVKSNKLWLLRPGAGFWERMIWRLRVWFESFCNSGGEADS